MHRQITAASIEKLFHRPKPKVFFSLREKFPPPQAEREEYTGPTRQREPPASRSQSMRCSQSMRGAAAFATLSS
jgi:hypothetical protein